MIEINGKVYRNLQEQVYKNATDIDELRTIYGFKGPFDTLADIESPIDLALYLVGTETPYTIYQYHDLTQNFENLGPLNQRGPQGPVGPQGPQGPKGNTGDPVTITVNGNTYTAYLGNITLPNYPTSLDWDAIENKPTKVSDFPNDAGYITKSVNDLTNYYDKTTIDGVVEDLDEDIAVKANSADLGTAAYIDEDNLSIAYTQLTGAPTNVSYFTNDAGYLTQASLSDAFVTTDTNQTITGNKTFSGSYIEVWNADTTRNEYSTLLPTSLCVHDTLANQDTIYGNREVFVGTKTSVGTAGGYSVVLRDYDGDGPYPDYRYWFKTGKSGEVAITSEIPSISGTNDGVNWTTLTLNGNTYGLADSPSYTAGTGIDITNNAISIDNTVALKSEIPTATSDLTNDSGYITGITSLMVTTALGYTPGTSNFSGNYNDLTNKPTIPTKVSDLANDSGFITKSVDDLTNYYDKTIFNRMVDDFDAAIALKANTADLATVATTGSYNDLINKPTIPDVSNYYTKAQVDNLIPTATSDLTNDSGYITGITSSDVTTALGYTPGTSNFSGDYDDLTDKPDLTVYAETADLGACAYLDENELSIAYSQITGTPSIPTKTSDLTNDSGFITGIAWNDVTNKPTFATVATTGDYDDLINKPTLFSGSYNDLTNKPDLTIYELAANAFSGDYNDLTNKPTIPTVPTNVSAFTNDAGYITGITSGMVTTALGYTPGTSNFSGDYDDLTDKPDLSIYAQSANLATVATTGSYSDLSNKPSIPSAASSTSTSTSTSTVTPTTVTLTFTYSDDTTENVTLMTGASVATSTTTTTTTTLS